MYLPAFSCEEVNQPYPETKYKYALSAASAQGHHDTVTHLLASGANVDSCSDEDPDTVVAARGEYYEREPWNRATLSGREIESFSGTALYVACSRGFAEVIKVLLTAGATIHYQKGDGCAPAALQAACLEGNLGIVNQLLQAGADINRVEGRYQTALQAACSVIQTDVINRLLEAEADVNAQGPPYGSALEATLLQERQDVILQILKAGADVNLTREHYMRSSDTFFTEWTALHTAVMNYKPATVRLLLDSGADVNIRTRDRKGYRCTPLHRAITRSDGDSAELMEMLLAAGADVHLLGTSVIRYEGTALHEAVGAGKPITVQMLLEAGADVHAKDERDQTLAEKRAQMVNNHIADTIVTLLLRAEAGELSKTLPTRRQSDTEPNEIP